LKLTWFGSFFFHFLLAHIPKVALGTKKKAPFVEVFFWQQGQKTANQQLNFTRASKIFTAADLLHSHTGLKLAARHHPKLKNFLSPFSGLRFRIL
jgi:hypothetical protein